MAATDVLERRATVEDLYNVEGPAELINGRIVHDMTGDRPTEVAGNVYTSLRHHAKKTGIGKARTDGAGYIVPLMASGRESFGPDASYHTKPLPNPMRFVEGAPDFAVEVRSENDYGPGAEERLADKRADYFAAGTLVVWDVDPEAETVRIYRASQPKDGELRVRSETASAEPAVPGWEMAIDDVFA